MADAQANIGIGIDTSQALAAIRQLQREISAFHTSMAKGGALASAESSRLQQNLVNSINETGKFSAGMSRISSSTESFTNALEKNKLSMGQYFRYAGGATKTFGKLFSKEFNTINSVAAERVKDLQTQYISLGRDASGALQAIKVRPLALDMDNLGAKVQMVAQKQQIFNQLLKQGTTNLLNFGKNTQWAGRQLMVGFTIPLTILGATAAREFQKIEEQAVKFRRVYGDMFTSTTETEKALKDVRALADEFTKYGIAVEKTIGLAAKVAQMGNAGPALEAQVKQATRLAVLGGLEQEEALETTISLTNAFGIAAEDLAGKIAFLNAAENQTILAIEDFNTAIPLSGSVVRQLGGDVEDLAVLLTAMREGGINASQAGNALKSSLGRLIAPSRNAKETLSGFGIDVLGIVENNAGNLMGTINTLAVALNNLDPLSRARSIEALFGKFQFARMSTLFANIIRDGSQASKVLELTTNSTQELAIIADRELKRVEESPAFRLQKQMEQLRASLAPIGEEFIKAVGPLIEFGTNILKSFNKMGDGAKQFTVILTTIAGVVAPALLMGFGLVANGVANLLKFFTFLGGTFRFLSGQGKILGTSTEYMTQQQIEAAAVAASLGQQHSNLAQVFAAEATSLNMLNSAYERAIVAQSGFLGAGAAGRGASARANAPKKFSIGGLIKKYATGGIIVGPGTGTSDSVVIRASNGEFVVNAEATEENLDILQAINQGKIKRFSVGGEVTSDGGKTVSFRGQTYESSTSRTASAISARVGEKNYSADVVSRAFEILSQKAEQAGEKLVISAQAFKIAAREAAEELGESSEDIARAHTAASVPASDPRTQEAMQKIGWDKIPEKYQEHVYGVPNLTADMGQTANLRLRNNNLEAADFNKEWFGRTGKYQGSAAAGGLDLSNQENVNALQQIEDEVGQEVLRVAKERADAEGVAVENIKIGDAELAAAADLVIQRYQDKADALGESARALRARRDEVGELRSSPGKAVIDEGLTSGEMRQVGDRIDVMGTDGKWVEGYARGGASKGSRYNKKPLSKSYASQPKMSVPAEGPLPDIQESAVAGERNAKAYNDGVASKAKDIKDVASEKAGRGSPHPEAFPDGADDAREYLRGQDSVLNANSDPYKRSNLAPPPPPPIPTPAPPGLGSRVKSAVSSGVERLGDTKIGKTVHKKLAQASGVAAADSKGNIFYDPNEDINTVYGKMEAQKAAMPKLPSAAGGVVPVKIIDGYEMDPAFQETVERGTVESENLNDVMVANRESTDKNTKASKEEIETDKKQRRASLAGKAFGVLSAGTMVAGMATQVDGVVGETAQKLVGPLAAISGMLPVLMALGPLWGTLLAVIGGGVALWMMYNNALKEARKEAFELTRAMGVGSDAIQKFAEFAGTATSTEVASRQREQRQNIMQLQPGTKTFGSAFIEGESGQEMVETTRKALQSFGKDDTIKQIYMQLGTAILQGALSQDQAISIAAALGQEIGDLDLGMSINGKLIQLLGPNGENLLTDPLTLQTQINQESIDYQQRALDTTFQSIADLKEGTSITIEGTTINTYSEEAQDMIRAEREQRQAEMNGWDRFWSGFTLNDNAVRDLLVAEAEGEAMGLFVNNIEAGAAMIDAQRVAAQKAIDEAIARGATEAELNDIRKQEAASIKSLTDQMDEANSAIFEWWSSLPESEQRTRRKEQEDRIVAAAEAKGLSGRQVRADLNALTRVGGDSAYNLVIRTAVETGIFDEAQLASIIDSFNNEEDKEIIADLVTKVGGEADNLLNVLSSIENADTRTEILTIFKTLDTEDALEKISDLDYLYKTSEIFDGIDIPIQFFTTGGGDLKKTMDIAEQIQNLGKTGGLIGEGGTLNLEAYANIVGADIAARAQAAAAAQGEMFDKLDEAAKTEFFTMFAINAQLTGDPTAVALLKSQGLEYGMPVTGAPGSAQQQAGLDNVLGRNVINLLGQSKALPFGDGDGEGDGKGGGGTQDLDSLLKKLRDLRIATIDLKKGWEGMQQVLSKVFEGGTKSLNIFDGLSNQIRKFGVGESLIEMIVGMDPDEYEKRKKDLFTFDKAGNITGVTAKLKNMQAAFNAIALGEYVNQQQRSLQTMRDQISAINILTANGLSLAEAYELVQDEALAAAIALGATKQEIAEIIKLTQQVSALRKKIEKEDEKAQASKAVRKTNEEFEKQVQVLSKLSKEAGKYTDAQIDAIFGDSNLQTLFLNPSIDQNALNQAIYNASRNAEIQLQVKLKTAEGQLGVFEEGFGKAMEAFATQEQTINLKFQAEIEEDENIARAAESQIAALQFELDDYQAEITRIEDQEKDINDAYEKRFEALDKVAKANERIAAAQKSQLDIADALSRGDIAAAARAAQEARAKQAADASATEKERLERARDAQIAALTGRGGMNREQLEEQIRRLEMQIFNIEEDELEPAQERMRLAQEARDAQIRSLEVLGKTRAEWEQIKNNVDVAVMGSWQFVEAMETALSIVEQLIESLGKPKPLPEPPPPAPSGGGGGGGGGAPAPAAPSSNKIKTDDREPFDPLKLAPVTVPLGGNTYVVISNPVGTTVPLGGGRTIQTTPTSNQRTTNVVNIGPAAKPSPPKTTVPLGGGRTIQVASGGLIRRLSSGGKVRGYSMGGLIPYMANGGEMALSVMPNKFRSLGSDTVPAMLTPGEFVIRRPAVNKIGIDKLEKLNRNASLGGSVYNYNLSVNVKSDADPSRIAQTVIKEIKRIDSQRVRGNKF
jgi:TP901 family phage tail tape measure protein